MLEFILDIVLEGALTAAGSKKVPMPIRILLGGVILLFFLGIAGLMFWVGISTGNVLMVVLAAAFLASFLFWVYQKGFCRKRDGR